MRSLLALAALAPLLASSLLTFGCSGKVIEADDGPCAGVSCGEHGACIDGACACEPGYRGDACEDCAQGFGDDDGDGNCEPIASNPCEGVDCGTHGQCVGTAGCICDTGYDGIDCSSCAGGFQDNDGDGVCTVACGSAMLACVHGVCSDVSGTAACVCEDGWYGATCAQCEPGWQDNDGDGVCTPDCSEFPECENGTCDDTEGTAHCVCNDGFQDNDGDGVCLPSCSGGNACPAHSVCEDTTGQALCECEAGYEDDGQGGCVPVSGECGSPIDLDIFQGQVTGNTNGAGNDFEGSCQYESGPDRVYRFSVADPIRIRFHMSGFDTVLYARNDCGSAGSEIACSDDDGPDHSSVIERDFDPGTYYLFADGWGSASGPYTLTIELSCADGWVLDPATSACVPDPCEPNPCAEPHKTQCEALPPTDYACTCDPGYIADPNAPATCMVDPNPHGESCADAIWLDPAGGSLQASTTDASNDGEGTCGGSGPDRVYGLELPQRSRVEVSMSGYDTVLHMRSTCTEQSSEVGCNDDDGMGVGSSLVTFLDAGSYYVFADSYSEPGDYELSWSVAPDPCAGDPCPGLPECVASADWSTFTCECPAGTLPYGSDCVDDPCEPNLCLSGPDHRFRCEPQLATGDYQCLCSPGYMEDSAHPGGPCVLDPDANDWSFIVFMNGDNNLEYDAFADLQEMAAAGSTDNVHIVALLDTYSANGGNARKLYVTQSGFDEVENMGELDMGNWETLAEFGVWAVENYPARHYALVLWDHGDGWKSSKAPKPWTKAFSNDDHGTNDGISISNGDFARALQAITATTGDKLDLVGFDACLMGMWEVAEASAPYAHTFVGSEETEPLEGWSYDAFLPPLVANPDMTAIELGTAIVNTYHAESSDNSTLAVSNLDTMPALRAAMSAFADALAADPAQFTKIESARSASESFTDDSDRDLWDFANRVGAIGGASPELVAAAEALKTQLSTTVVHSQAQSSYPGAHGLSVYLPARGSHMDPDYVGAGAVWSQSTTWDEFVSAFAQ